MLAYKSRLRYSLIKSEGNKTNLNRRDKMKNQEIEKLRIEIEDLDIKRNIIKQAFTVKDDARKIKRTWKYREGNRI